MGRNLRACSRSLVLNTVGAYGGGPRQNPLPGYLLVTEPGELVNRTRNARERGALRVLYQPAYDIETQFPALCSLVYEMRDTVFAVDEVSLFTKPGWSCQPFRNIMLMGRIRGLSLAWTSQFPQLVDERLLSQCTEMYVGTLSNERDLEKIRNCFTAIGEEAAAAIRTCPRHTLVHVRESGEWEMVR